MILLVLLLAIPLGLDRYLPVPEDNPLTREKIELGRRLFNDRRLSRDQSVACASCHNPNRAFSTPLPTTIGVGGRRTPRNAPALINRAYGRTFFWDGRTSSLEEQVLKPIQDPNEMDLTLEQAAARTKLDVPTMSRALASYVRSILSGDSPYDRYVNGDRSALSSEQQLGLAIFRGKGNCTACHVGPGFTDEQFHNTGVAWRTPSAGSGQAGSFADEGRFAISRNLRDRGAFKTPTLREVARTAPYMHDGSFAALEDVVEFYSEGGRPNANVDGEIRPRHFTSEEKRALVAFLRSLSGRVTEGSR
jgi:cytochrome c peroxidase